MSSDHIRGDTIGAWCLDHHLGSGEFGETWKARDATGRTCALKILRVMPGDELRVLSRLAHPAIPAVLGAAARPVPHVAMEYAPGRSLDHMLRRGRAPEPAALQVVAVLADALAEVHRAGLAHGDIKPENILVERISDLRIWLVDFGAAADNAIGTLHYAAPERTKGGAASSASDIYSLGLVLFEMLFGHLPGFDESVSAALMQRRTRRPTIPSTTPRVHALLSRMLEVEPAARPSAADVADALEAHGLRLPPPTGALLRRRARAVHVPPPGLAEHLSPWLEGDGHLAVVGAARTGRTHAIDRAQTELSARGTAWIRLPSDPTPWQAVTDALQAPVLSGPPAELPSEPDPTLRAKLAAAAIVDRAGGSLRVLVDNFDEAAPSTKATVLALMALPEVQVLVSTTEPPPCDMAVCTLEPMGPDALGTLLTSILADPCPLDDLVQRLTRDGPVVPGAAIEALATACDAGLLHRRARRWHLQSTAFADLWERLQEQFQAELVTSSPEVTDLAALVAIFGGPVEVSRLADMAWLPRDAFHTALSELVDRGIVHLEGGLAQIDSPRIARAAERASTRTPDLHGRVLRGSIPRTPLQLLTHLAGAQCLRLTTQLAPDAIRESIALDPEHTARLAARLWEDQPHPDIGGAVLSALIAGGQTARARELGELLLQETEPPLDVLLTMARIYIQVADDAPAALRVLALAEARCDAEHRLQLALLRAQAHFQAGAFTEAIGVAQAACADAPGPRPTDQEAWVILQQTRAQATHEAGDITAAIAILEAVPPDYAAGRPCRGVLMGALGRLFWHAGRVRDAATTLAEAALLDGMPTLERARLENNAGVAFYSCGDRRKALQRWEQAFEHFVQLDNPLEQIRVSNNLCVAYTEAGRWERARVVGERAFALAEERDQPVYAAMVAGNLGDLHAAREQWSDARTWYRTASALAQKHDLESEQVELARRVAAIAVRQSSADAELRARQAISIAEAAGDEVEATRARILWLLCRARATPPAPRISEQLADAIEVFRQRKLTGHIAEARAWSAEAHLELGDPATAVKLLDLAAAHASSAGHVPLQTRVADLQARARAMTVRTPERDKFERMIELATAVAREQDPSQLLDLIAAAGLELLDAERSFVVLMEGSAQRVVRAIDRNGPLTDPLARPSRTILEKALYRRTAYTALDVSERQELSASKSIALNALRSAMCVPMRDGEELLGLLYVDSTRTTEEQLGEAAHLMQALASHAAVAIGHARQLAALEQRAAKAAELVHDLRSPLAAAASILEELRDDHIAEGLSPRVHDEALGLLAKSMQLAEMVLGGAHDHKETVVDLASRLTELGHQLDRQAQRDGKSVFVEVNDEARTLCNPDHLDRIVRNLVGNALRFSPDDGTVLIRLRSTEDGAQISVIDEGEGIPAPLLGTLFQRGTKGDTDKSQHGLGLAIVARLVKELGGTVRAENVESAGACFIVTLPVVRAVVRKAV